MSAVNIRRDVKDDFYRYKMPRLISKIEGKGNGIKTVVQNMAEISKALSRPPAYPTKFFGIELGALVICDDKTSRYIVNGAHDAEKLQSLLDVFITKFVLCENCDNPETTLSVKREIVWRDCKACGFHGQVDQTHRLVAYILKSPPPKQPKRESADTINAENQDGAKGQGEEYEEGMSVPAGEFEFLENAKAKLDDGDWVGEAHAAESQELAQLSEKMRSGMAIRPKRAKAKADDSTLEAFAGFLESAPDASDAEVLQQVEKLGLAVDKAVAVLVQVWFDSDFLAKLQSHISLLRRMLGDEKSQKAFLGSMERVAGLRDPSLVKKIPVVLQKVYVEDLVDESRLKKWNAHVSTRYVSEETGRQIREAAKPFFVWLEQAEAETSDDGEDEEDEEE